LNGIGGDYTLLIILIKKKEVYLQQHKKEKKKGEEGKGKTKQSHGTIVSWLQHIYSWIYG
jgi:ribosomal protein S25